MIQALAYHGAAALTQIVRAFPLKTVAAIGRFGGGLAYWLDARHRRAAVINISRCFPTKSAAEARALAREHFRRLGENYISALKTSAMTAEQLQPYLEVRGMDKIAPQTGAIIAVGHFGNFEIYARIAKPGSGYKLATTYRPLNQPGFDALVKKFREQSGCVFFDRRRDVKAMQDALRSGKVMLGLLCDQHAGSRGLRLPFLGHECSVNNAPALLALRYNLPLYTAICFRTGPAQWAVEFSDAIPTRVGGRRRTPGEVMDDVNKAFERAVLRDPPNWFWVHDRWRFAKGQRPLGARRTRLASEKPTSV